MKLTNHIEFQESTDELIVTNKGNRTTIKLENQLSRMLVLLVEHKEEVVKKEAFIETIWDGNSFTGEQALTKNIYKLRELIKQYQLTDSLTIETVPKKGYRLLIHSPKKKINKWVIGIPILILLGVLATFFMSRDSSPKKDPMQEVQVIDLNDHSKDTVIFLEPDSNKVRVYRTSPSDTTFTNLDSLK